MVHFTIEIKNNIDQVLNTTRTASSAVWQTIPERKDSTGKNKSGRKLLRFSYPYHIVILQNSNYGNFSKARHVVCNISISLGIPSLPPFAKGD